MENRTKGEKDAQSPTKEENNIIEELQNLAKLKEEGYITEEFISLKIKLIK